MLAHDVIIRPIVTEKTMLGMPDKKYTFKVAKNAGKIILFMLSLEKLSYM